MQITMYFKAEGVGTFNVSQAFKGPLPEKGITREELEQFQKGFIASIAYTYKLSEEQIIPISRDEYIGKDTEEEDEE